MGSLFWILRQGCYYVNMGSMNLSKNVLKYRKLRGLTQREAERRARLPRTTLTRVETGQRSLGVLKLKALARVLRVTTDELLGG